MSNYRVQAGPGNNFNAVARKALDLAIRESTVVEFVFNGVTCLVNKNTNVQWLLRDYENSFTMEWETIGPDCVAEYVDIIGAELKSRLELIKEKQEVQRLEWEKHDKQEREAFESSVKGIEISIIPSLADQYAQYVEVNSKDGYSRSVLAYGDGWARLMQKAMMDTGKSVAEVAEETQKGLGFLGITGYQYGCAVTALAKFWEHGEELRKWHNKEYKHEGDGVVNPAVLTFSPQ